MAPFLRLSTNRVHRRRDKGDRIRPSTNPRTAGTPEIYFRVIHVTPEHGKHAFAQYRQTVEVTLGPWGAFANGNIGCLERVIHADRLVSAVATPRGRLDSPKPPEPPRTAKPPRIIDTLRLAQEWQRQLGAGEIESQAAIARREGLTPARVTQVLALLRLPHAILHSIRALAEGPNPSALSEAALRPITLIKDSEKQLAAFEGVLASRS